MQWTEASNWLHIKIHHKDIVIHNFGQLFWIQIEMKYNYQVSGLGPGYDQNVHINSIFINLPNGLLYYPQPLYNSMSTEHLNLKYKVEYTQANQGILPQAQKIWVQYTQCEEHYLKNTFRGLISSFPVYSFIGTPLYLILLNVENKLAAKTILTNSQRCTKC